MPFTYANQIRVTILLNVLQIYKIYLSDKTTLIGSDIKNRIFLQNKIHQILPL